MRSIGSQKIPTSSTRAVLLCACGCLVLATAQAQVAAAKVQSASPAPPVIVRADDDAGTAGELPLDTPDVRDPRDVSSVSSPIVASSQRGWIGAETPLHIKLNSPVSSGVQRNGDAIAGVLLQPVITAKGRTLPAGTPVKATVLSAARAGQLQSAGVLSLQVFQVGGLSVISNVLEFTGQEGHREVADANPDKGTEAIVQAGAPLEFKALGSGDKPDPNEPPETLRGAPAQAGSQPGTIRPGQGSVGAPGSSPNSDSNSASQRNAVTTPIHGTTTPHP